jgi:hypothetical protein
LHRLAHSPLQEMFSNILLDLLLFLLQKRKLLVLECHEFQLLDLIRWQARLLHLVKKVLVPRLVIDFPVGRPLVWFDMGRDDQLLFHIEQPNLL